MTDPAFLAALEAAIARTGVERYRFLTLEHADPAVRADYRRLVTEIASGTHTGATIPRATHHAPRATPPRPCCGGTIDPYAR